MYYVTPRGGTLSVEVDKAFDRLHDAQEYALELREKNGGHYYVVKVETVWFTTTLADLLEEDSRKA